MKNPSDLPGPSVGRALLPALVTTVLSVLTVVGGTAYAEVSLEEGRFRGDFDGPWNLLIVDGMHPFGYTGLILEGDNGFAPTFSNSLGYFLVGLGVMAVVVFLVALLVLGSLVPGRSALAAWVGTWFATIVGAATGALGVDVVRTLVDDDAAGSGFALWMGARQWVGLGAYWGLVLGWLIGAVVVILWVVRGSGRRGPAAAHPTNDYPAAAHPAAVQPTRDRLGDTTYPAAGQDVHGPSEPGRDTSSFPSAAPAPSSRPDDSSYRPER